MRAAGILAGKNILDDMVPAYRFILLNDVDPEIAHIPRPTPPVLQHRG